MLSALLWSLAYGVTSALLGLLSITDMLGMDAASAASQPFRRVLHAERDLPVRLAAAAR